MAAAKPLNVVLLDGDGYPFHDNLVLQGYSGGEQAAQPLLNNVKSFWERCKGADQWNINLKEPVFDVGDVGRGKE